MRHLSYWQYVSESKKFAACEFSLVLYWKTLKKLRRTIQNKWCGMLTSGVVLLHDNVHLHTTTRTEHCWSISTGSCLTTLLTELISLPPLTYLKNWFWSQHFNNNELIEGFKMWLTSTVAISLTQACKNSFPNKTSDSILVMTRLRSSLSMYFLYTIIFFC
jgi:hypothetical protein